jgi:hypothetical protein
LPTTDREVAQLAMRRRSACPAHSGPCLCIATAATPRPASARSKVHAAVVEADGTTVSGIVGAS